jgi:hypothetical protein
VDTAKSVPSVKSAAAAGVKSASMAAAGAWSAKKGEGGICGHNKIRT